MAYKRQRHFSMLQTSLLLEFSLEIEQLTPEASIRLNEPSLLLNMAESFLKISSIFSHKVLDNDCGAATDTGIAMYKHFSACLNGHIKELSAPVKVFF